MGEEVLIINWGNIVLNFLGSSKFRVFEFCFDYMRDWLYMSKKSKKESIELNWNEVIKIFLLESWVVICLFLYWRFMRVFLGVGLLI